jgi:predicted DsbA family dithiol-disulfide isomerase
MRVDIWSDLVCPWCYVGKRRFERGLAAFEHRDDVEVVHRSFQLDPHSPPGKTFDRQQVLQQKYGWSATQAQEMDARMIETAAAEGLEYHLAGGVTGNTMDAHQLVHLAEARGRLRASRFGAQGIQDAVVERFYRAHFTEQRSIFDHESLIALGREAGLDGDEASRVLARGTYAEAVTTDNAEAKTLGANGVPFYVFAPSHRRTLAPLFGVSGAQSSDVFTSALTRAWNETTRQVAK